MKKSFIILMLAIMGFVGMFSSCSQTDIPEVEENVEIVKPASKGYVELTNQIKELNINNMHASRLTWWQKFKKRLIAVILADASGAMFGALVGQSAGPAGVPLCGIAGATACSAVAALWPSSNIEISTAYSRSAMSDEDVSIGVNEPNEALENTVCQLGSCPSFADSVGYYHNRILLEYYNNNTAPSEDVDSIIVGIYAEAANIFNVSPQTLYYDTSTAACLDPFFNNKLYQQDENMTMSNYCSRLKTYYPDHSSDIDVFEQIMEGILYIENIDETNYVERVIAYIQASDISQFHKECLINATLTGNASAKLWKIEN